ncbi:hypothetical protein GUITHDRAFT_156789 [Guillardia theta CCMP2712]|uniref:Uncharacterized protein n=1 Tax=Guillardia theta (strain CCMP2712) TaxID=905079 RepID=L1K4I7_GUITC|nr:hypothetical protein GUITHDRAFT_156789 [Guillardia theta CCMP2712]EKX55519.1 hypothetical protein GUITHDRAFT_156789 [Guillardia theta CCMP2712]|eukprot:XP_005842499.1 hypothetical protein GUITHDRAFT_156789 [Guillardia theta CCMP2712]
MAARGRLDTAARQFAGDAKTATLSDKWHADSNPFQGLVDPVHLALSRLRRRNYDKCIDVATELLGRHGVDQQVWWIKCRALTNKNGIVDTEFDEEGLAELLLDENATAQVPRPGTSLSRPQSSTVSGPSPAVRPMTNNGRPLSGFSRPGSGLTKPGTGMSLERAMTSSRVGTAMTRPVTTSGRFVRLGTASLQSEPGGAFVNLEKLNMQKYAERPSLAKALCDYMLSVEHNPRKAVELGAAATSAVNFADWWWKMKLGRGYYQLGLLREAELQYLSSLKLQEMVCTYLQLANVYLRLDQPRNALDVYKQSPEVALRYYRRLLQMGVSSSALWNNLGLCCFYAGLYDMSLTCFEQALISAEDDTLGDIWYNISHIAIGIGDLGLAYQTLKVAVAADPNHAEATNNLAILELRKGNVELARSGFKEAGKQGPHAFEPPFNSALLAYKLGDAQESFQLVQQALLCYPDHVESKELLEQLKQKFN